MSFLYSTLREQRPAGDAGDICLDFFFSARGSELQKTPLGMLRSLLNQLFAKEHCVRPHVRSVYPEKLDAFGSAKEDVVWHRGELESLLIRGIRLLAQEKQVRLFVDALDEAGEKSAQQLAIFFHRLNDLVNSSPARTKICISSRHYPIPAISPKLEIVVEQQNGLDIAKVINDRLRVECLSVYGEIDSAAIQALKEDLIDRADGIFQWASLTITMVERYIAEGESLQNVRLRLSTVPVELDELYKYVLCEVIRREYRKQSFLLFQWVSLAQRPLSAAELRYALAARDAAPTTPQRRCHETSEFIESDNRMKIRVRALSGGLVEIVHGEHGGEEMVQIIHQSVKEHLLSHGLNFMATSWTETFGMFDVNIRRSTYMDIIPDCHQNIYRSCLNYLATESTLALSRLRQCPRYQYSQVSLALLGFPLIKYATAHVFDHARRAESSSDEEIEESLRLFEQVVPHWRQLCSILMSAGLRSGTTSLHEAFFANRVLALSFMFYKYEDVNYQDRQGNTALYLAAIYGRPVTAKLLVEAGSHQGLKNEDDETALDLAIQYRHLSVVKACLSIDIDESEVRRNRNQALLYAAATGDLPLASLLLAAEVDINAKDGSSNTVSQVALANGRSEMLRLLMEAGADVDGPQVSHDIPQHSKGI